MNNCTSKNASDTTLYNYCAATMSVFKNSTNAEKLGIVINQSSDSNFPVIAYFNFNYERMNILYNDY